MSWMVQAFKLFEVMHSRGRDCDRKDLTLRLGMSDQVATNILARLKAAGCIRFSYGSTRTGIFYEFIAGSSLPEDRRGDAEGSRKALARARASRPVSNITAARQKVTRAVLANLLDEQV